jgi:hypothetical protein
VDFLSGGPTFETETHDMVEDWPKTGTLRGKSVLLEGIEMRLSQEDLEEVIVAIPDQGRVRPWRFASSGARIRTDEDGVLVIG